MPLISRVPQFKVAGLVAPAIDPGNMAAMDEPAVNERALTRPIPASPKPLRRRPHFARGFESLMQA